jgi:hypothetical protein
LKNYLIATFSRKIDGGLPKVCVAVANEFFTLPMAGLFKEQLSGSFQPSC